MGLIDPARRGKPGLHLTTGSNMLFVYRVSTFDSTRFEMHSAEELDLAWRNAGRLTA